MAQIFLFLSQMSPWNLVLILKPEEDDQLVPLTQAELNDLTRDLNHSKEST